MQKLKAVMLGMGMLLAMCTPAYAQNVGPTCDMSIEDVDRQVTELRVVSGSEVVVRTYTGEQFTKVMKELDEVAPRPEHLMAADKVIIVTMDGDTAWLGLAKDNCVIASTAVNKDFILSILTKALGQVI